MNDDTFFSYTPDDVAAAMLYLHDNGTTYSSTPDAASVIAAANATMSRKIYDGYNKG